MMKIKKFIIKYNKIKIKFKSIFKIIKKLITKYHKKKTK